jgi:uncharacterized protein DUF4019
MNLNRKLTTAAILRHAAWVCAVVLLAFGWVLAAEKPAGKPEDAALAAAEKWLKVVDAGDYAKSYEEAASLLKGALTQEKWELAVRASRRPLGKVASRKLKSREHTTTLPDAPAGEYFVIQFDTAFEKKPSSVETITPMLDTDGTWRVSGYHIR